MNQTFFYFFFLYFSYYVKGSYLDPSFAEKARYLSVKPKNTWGMQARKDCLKLLVIGGSNTARDTEQGYVSMLRLSIEGFYENSNCSSRHYVMNRGMGGSSPSYFSQTGFDFESYPKELWPNMVLLEFAVNFIDDSFLGISAAHDLSLVLRSLNYKWAMKGLPSPDYSFLELFNVQNLYSSYREYNTTESRVQHINSLTTVNPSNVRRSGFNRGGFAAAWITEFCRFYQIPMLSWREVSFMAFARYYLHNANSSSSCQWPYSDDGLHLNEQGSRYVVDNLLLPFFQSSLTALVVEANAVCDDALCGNPAADQQWQMFGRETISLTLRDWSSWGADRFNSLATVTIPSKHWRFQPLQRHENDSAHTCYCSREASSTAVLNISVPAECTPMFRCELGLGVILSWNASYIGNATCSLAPADESLSKGVRSAIRISGQRVGAMDIRDTAPYLFSASTCCAASIWKRAGIPVSRGSRCAGT